ncbi:MAG: aminodeoxychorismate/anthranilate synthase component II [Rhodospirillaceae bacterium]|nr:MAG: aminodeoxychorismate/anthranilate synthase component II [Rhodospirillaceae bacterium]
MAQAKRYLLIDNYDSFTYNLWHFLSELGADVVVHRNDKITVDACLNAKPAGIILSPGPCDPDRAGICLPLIAAAAGKVPVLGVCLGHQAIGQAFGGKVVRAPLPMHGKVSAIHHTGHAMFKGIPSPFDATRYHSLIVDRATLPADLEITAATNDGLIMGLAHKRFAITGVQFHPESIASQCGHRILRNFLVSTGLDAKPEPAPHKAAAE